MKLQDVWRPFKLIHYCEQPEDLRNSNFNERPSANADVKKSQ